MLSSSLENDSVLDNACLALIRLADSLRAAMRSMLLHAVELRPGVQARLLSGTHLGCALLRLKALQPHAPRASACVSDAGRSMYLAPKRIVQIC